MEYELKTLKELKTFTNAFDGFETVQNSTIPDYYKSIFPSHCECGAEMILDANNYTKLQCCNPNCKIKYAYKLSSFISYFGFKGIGDETCKTIMYNLYDRLPIPSFLAVFMLPDEEVHNVIGDAKFEIYLDIKSELKKSTVWLRDAMASLSISGIGANSKLLSTIKDYKIILNFLLKDKTSDLLHICGINNKLSHYGLKAAKLDVFILFSKILGGIKIEPKGEIFIAITGSVSVKGKPLTRAEFVELCSAFKDDTGQPLFKLTETKATSKLEYVIADAPSSSSKYSIGLEKNILITADEFYNILEKEATAVREKEEPEDAKTTDEVTKMNIIETE